MEDPTKAQYTPGSAGKDYSTSSAGGDRLAKKTASESASNKTVRHTPSPLPKGKIGGEATP